MNAMVVNGRLLVLWAVCYTCFFTADAWPETASPEVMPTLSASVDKDTAKTGERVWLTLTYALPDGARLSEEPVVHGIENLKIVERIVGRNEIKIGFTVDRLESFKIESIGLVYTDKDGNERQIDADPVDITVDSNLGEKPQEAALMENEDIEPTDSPWSPYLPWGAASILVLGIVAGLLLWKKKRRSHGIEATPGDPPHVRAEKEIDRLVTGGLFERGDIKTFYFMFSEIIRRYMEAIRKFPAAEMTTEEIARCLGTDADDQEIMPLLRQTDLIKFADAVPTTARKDQDIRAAMAYIRQTAQASPQTPEAGQ